VYTPEVTNWLKRNRKIIFRLANKYANSTDEVDEFESMAYQKLPDIFRKRPDANTAYVAMCLLNAWRDHKRKASKTQDVQLDLYENYGKSSAYFQSDSHDSITLAVHANGDVVLVESEGGEIKKQTKMGHCNSVMVETAHAGIVRFELS
jgi:hypothetical protein